MRCEGPGAGSTGKCSFYQYLVGFRCRFEGAIRWFLDGFEGSKSENQKLKKQLENI